MWARGLALLAAITGCDQVFGLERTPEVPEPPGDWAAVTAGERTTCGLRLDGTVWCWGTNQFGQLGDGAVDSATPIQIGTSSWRSISAGGGHTCVIRDDGALYCWGTNGYGELGVGDYASRFEPTLVSAGPWDSVDAGQTHTCAIAHDTTLWCWGSNDTGQLGDGTTDPRSVPVPVSSGARDHWTSISLGTYHTCGIRDGDTLWCWGQSLYGALADPNLPDTTVQRVPNRAPGAWSTVASGGYHTCALSPEHHARCWGSNTAGQLGDGTTTSSPLGVIVGGDAADWIDLAAGDVHTCGRRMNGTLYCWGDSRHGQIASPDASEIVSLPVAIPAKFDGWTGPLALGLYHTCAIDDAHRLWCVGGNGAGQLGRGTGTHLRPIRLDGTWTDAAAGEQLMCALDANREARCWGSSSYSALGDGTMSSRQVPTPIVAAGPWKALTVGAKHACARNGGERWCWGNNSNYQLGVGAGAPAIVYLPKQIIDGHWPTTARDHACSLDNGQLWCWGANYYGEVGVGDMLGHGTPTLLSTPPVRWNFAGAGTGFTCAASDNALYCWGSNGAYQLGDGSMVAADSPVLISSGTFDALSVGSLSSCALRGTTAWCWGNNGGGVLGTGDGDNVPIPTAIEGEWRTLAIGYTHSCAIAIDGSMWCWGDNTYGNLGDGTTTRRYSPTRISTDTDWVRPIVGAAHSCALKTDNSLWCWGGNDFGQIGDGTAWSNELQRVD